MSFHVAQSHPNKDTDPGLSRSQACNLQEEALGCESGPGGRDSSHSPAPEWHRRELLTLVLADFKDAHCSEGKEPRGRGPGSWCGPCVQQGQVTRPWLCS